MSSLISIFSHEKISYDIPSFKKKKKTAFSNIGVLIYFKPLPIFQPVFLHLENLCFEFWCRNECFRRAFFDFSKFFVWKLFLRIKNFWTKITSLNNGNKFNESSPDGTGKKKMKNNFKANKRFFFFFKRLRSSGLI